MKIEIQHHDITVTYTDNSVETLEDAIEALARVLIALGYDAESVKTQIGVEVNNE